MPNYRSINGKLVEERGEVFSERRYGSVANALEAAKAKARALRRDGFTVKRTLSHEFGAYHVAWWSPSGEVCGRCQKAIQHLIQGGARCATCYSLDLAEVKTEAAR